MRGYQKRVVFLKNTGSPYFEEAYFVIRCEEERDRKTTEELVAEASRIIDENFGRKKRIDKKAFLSHSLCFIIGALISAVAVLILF